MYTCRACFLYLSDDFFVEAGVLLTFPDRDVGLGACELEFSSGLAIEALPHWRRSPSFQPVQSMFFILSGDSVEWSAQMRLLVLVLPRSGSVPTLNRFKPKPNHRFWLWFQLLVKPNRFFGCGF